MFLPWSILPSFLRSRSSKASERLSSPRARRQKWRQPRSRTLSLDVLETRIVPATFFVDVTNPAVGTGTSLDPFRHLQDAVKAANASGAADDIFVFGNTSADPQNVYVWTRDGDRNSDGLLDGNIFVAANDRLTFRAQTLLQGPSGAPAPVIVKMGTNIVDVAGQLRVEGSAAAQVFFTSLQDDAIGGDTNNDGAISQPLRLDWGGIRFRGSAVDQGPGSATGSFISFANIRYTGATLFDPVSSQDIEFASVRMEYDGVNAAQVRVWDTTFERGGKALDVQFKALAGTGPDVGAGGGAIPGQGAQHPLTFIDNSINGLFVNIPFLTIIPLFDVNSQWDDVGVPYVLTQRLKLEADLTIDPGMVVKFQNNAIVDASLSPTDNGSSPNNDIFVNGTVEKPVLFTSLSDDDMGVLAPFYNNGSADTGNDGISFPQPGDWGGIRVANGFMDHAIIRYGGGSVPTGTGFFVNQSPLEIITNDFRPFGPLQDFQVSNTEITLSLGVVPTVDVSGDGLIAITDNYIHENAGLAIRGASSTYGRIYHPLGGYGIHYRRNILENNANNGVFSDTISGTGYIDDTDITLTIGTQITTTGTNQVRQIQSRREAIPYVDITINTATDYLRRFQGTGLANAQFQAFITQLQGQGINQGPFAAFPGDNGLFFRRITFETTARGISIPGATAGAPGNLRGEEWRDIGVDFTTAAATGLFPIKALASAGAVSGTNVLTTANTTNNDSSLTLTFPNMVSAVGFWVTGNLSTNSNESIEFFGDSGQLLESIPMPTTGGGPVFVGRISKQPIHRIVITENAGDGDLAGIDDLYYVDAGESLVIKMADRQMNDALVYAGMVLPPTGNGFDAEDVNPTTGAFVLGPTFRVLGQPDAPVFFTSVRDDTIGAGPVGHVVNDVNNDGANSSPASGAWTGIQIRPGVNSSKIEFVTQNPDGTIVRKSSDRNPYTIGDETDVNPALSSIPDTLTRLITGVVPATQNLQDGTLIEHATIRYASIGIDNQGYPDGKLMIEQNEYDDNDDTATADVLVPLVLTHHAATRVGAEAFVLGAGNVNMGQWDVDFFQLANVDEPLGGVPPAVQRLTLAQRASYVLGVVSVPLYVDVDHTPNPQPGQIGAGAPRQYNIYVFNENDQLVYLNGPDFGDATNFLGPIMEIPGSPPADFASTTPSDWDAEYVVIAPRAVLPRVLVSVNSGGLLPDGLFPTLIPISSLSPLGGEGYALTYVNMNGDIQNNLQGSSFTQLFPPPNPFIYNPEGYEMEVRTPNVSSGGTDRHFGNANDAIRNTDGEIIFRQNLITNFSTAGVFLQDQEVTVANVLIPTQTGRYFYANRDRDNGGAGSPFTNPNMYTPGIQIYNNVIADGQGAGIVVSEYTPFGPEVNAPTGYHQIHNNTIYNNQGHGIDITSKGGPNILDNIIVKNNTGILVNDLGFNGATTVANYNLFFDNSANISGPTNGGNNLFNVDPLFVDAANLDLRIFARPGGQPSSPGVDAALSNLSDRLFAMRDPDVATRVPNDDFRNRRRNDNPVKNNVGSGQFPFYDTGALESTEPALRVISVSPFFTTTGIVPGPVATFVVQFAGRVDPGTVNTTTIKVRKSGVNQPLATITNVYDPVHDIHTFTFTFSNPLGDGDYTIFMDGTASNNSDPAIRDIAGQLLDGEFPPPATAPDNSFPSGNNVPGGDFNYDFAVVTSSIGDLVWNDANGDGVKQANEAGIPNVTIDLREAGPDGIPGTGDDLLLPSQVTNASGNYVFGLLAPGTYLVDVRDPTLPSNFVNTNPPEPRVVILGISDQRDDIDFGFREDLQNASIGDLVWNDQNGDGVKQAGEPGIGGVKIDLTGSGPDLVLGTLDDVVFPSQFTNSSGSYLFSNLPGWSYTVDVDNTSSALSGFGLTTGNDPLSVTLDPAEQFLGADFGFIQQNSSIAGLVWEDSDGNGMLNGVEVGLAGVQVFIDLDDDNQFDVGEPTATSTASGGYIIDNLVPGSYKVTVNFSTLPPGNYIPTTPIPQIVDLDPNEDVTGVDFGFQVDPQNSQLGGKVFSDLFGDGAFTPGDSGLGGINIQLTWAGRDGLFSTGDEQVFGPFVTNGLGDWSTLADMPAGIYQVLVQNPPSPGYVLTSPGGNPRTINVSVSEVLSTIDFGFQQRQASIGDRVWQDDNGDGIQDGGEIGINGASVTLRYAGPDGMLGTPDDELQGPVLTSGDGNYLFTNLGAGQYRISVTPPAGLAPTVPNNGIQEVVLPGGDPGSSLPNVDFGFRAATSGIGDRVFNDINGDGIQQGGEIGIFGVRVFLDLNNNGTFEDMVDSDVTTDASGSYQFLNLFATSYRVIVDQTSLPAGTVPTIPNPPDVMVSLASDEINNDVDFGFQLPPGSPGGIFYLTVKGIDKIKSSDGSKLPVKDTDIIRLVVATDGSYDYSLYFRGKDFGLTPGSERIDAFSFLPDGDILISTIGSYNVKPSYSSPGQGSGTNISGFGEDILRFRPTDADTNGRITEGSFRNFAGSSTGLYFDGSTKGLSGTSENVDSVSVLSDGRLLLSTIGTVTVSGLSNRQATDILAYNPSNNSWSLYFEGTDVGLTGSAENVAGLFVGDPSASLPTLYFSTTGSFAVAGASGDKRDIFSFNPTNLGSNTQGSFSSGLVLDGSQTGLNSGDLTGMWLGLAPGSFPLHAAGTPTLPASTTQNYRWVETDGVVNVWIDTSNGLLDDAEADRVRDALAVLNAAWQQAGGPRLVEVASASQADIRVSSQPGSLIGGMNQGILGTAQVSFTAGVSGTLANGETFHQIQGHEYGALTQVILIDGWNWYAGADAAGITAGQYDLQSVAAHELGHAVGLLDNQGSSSSVMFETLLPGQVRRLYSGADLASLDELYAAGAELTGAIPVALETPADSGLSADVFQLLNPLQAGQTSSIQALQSQSPVEKETRLPLGTLDRQAADVLFAAATTGSESTSTGRSQALDAAAEWWTGLAV